MIIYIFYIYFHSWLAQNCSYAVMVSASGRHYLLYHPLLQHCWRSLWLFNIPKYQDYISSNGTFYCEKRVGSGTWKFWVPLVVSLLSWHNAMSLCSYYLKSGEPLSHISQLSAWNVSTNAFNWAINLLYKFSCCWKELWGLRWCSCFYDKLSVFTTYRSNDPPGDDDKGWWQVYWCMVFRLLCASQSVWLLALFYHHKELIFVQLRAITVCCLWELNIKWNRTKSLKTEGLFVLSECVLWTFSCCW